MGLKTAQILTTPLYHEAIIQQIWEIEKMHQIMNAQMEEIQQIKAEMT